MDLLSVSNLSATFEQMCNLSLPRKEDFWHFHHQSIMLVCWHSLDVDPGFGILLATEPAKEIECDGGHNGCHQVQHKKRVVLSGSKDPVKVDHSHGSASKTKTVRCLLGSPSQIKLGSKKDGRVLKASSSRFSCTSQRGSAASPSDQSSHCAHGFLGT